MKITWDKPLDYLTRQPARISRYQIDYWLGEARDPTKLVATTEEAEIELQPGELRVAIYAYDTNGMVSPPTLVIWNVDTVKPSRMHVDGSGILHIHWTGEEGLYYVVQTQRDAELGWQSAAVPFHGVGPHEFTTPAGRNMEWFRILRTEIQPQ